MLLCFSFIAAATRAACESSSLNRKLLVHEGNEIFGITRGRERKFRKEWAKLARVDVIAEGREIIRYLRS